MVFVLKLFGRWSWIDAFFKPGDRIDDSISTKFPPKVTLTLLLCSEEVSPCQHPRWFHYFVHGTGPEPR